MAEQICCGEHSGHICVLASNQKFEEIKAITKNPKHIALIAEGLRIRRRIFVIPCR